MSDEAEVPLTRSKGQKIEVVQPLEQNQTEPVITSTDIIKKPRKPRAPKTPAQLEAFKKASETRRKNIELKKAQQTLEANKVISQYEAVQQSNQKVAIVAITVQ